MSRKICVVTGTRAEYGCLRWVMEGIRNSSMLDLQLLVTGMHLSTEFGSTHREIERDGLPIDGRVETLLSTDSPTGITKAMGLGLIGFGDELRRLRPDLLLVLGDRFEIFAAVAAALVSGIPVAHAHGGELTEGAFDDAIRHSITKMAHLHFVAAEVYRRRVIQLGEDPRRVFQVGALGLDNINELPLLNRRDLEASLGFQLGPRNLLITFHPATLDFSTSPAQQMHELLAALDTLEDTRLIFTLPNADPGGRELSEIVQTYVAAHSSSRVYTSLGQLRYLSCIRHVDGVVGNSSSGLIEVPALRKGTVNVGERQRGRLKADSVIDCAADRSSIAAALKRLYSEDFQAGLPGLINPYGDGGAAGRIIRVLESYPLDSILKKSFCDVRF